MINRIIKVEGESFNVDLEVQKYIDAFKSSNPLKSAKVYNFAYPDQCSDLSSILDAAENDTSCLVIVAGIIGNIGEEGSAFLKTYEKNDCIITANGPGNLYFYDMHGIYLFSSWGNNYHGIYFTNHAQVQLMINFKKNETQGDIIAKSSNFFISDNNIAYLKEMQKKCNADGREYGGLVSLGGANGEMFFEECTSCSATSISLEGSLSMGNYSNYTSKEFIAHWHTHPNFPSVIEETQTPSGWIRAIQFNQFIGDFFVFKNSNIWQGEFLDAEVSAQNTWRLPGRIGLIAGELGITVYRFAGSYYEKSGPSPGGYFSCSYIPEGVCYKKKGTIQDLNLIYSWVKYNLSFIKK